MTKTLLEMSNLQQVERNESIQLAPMVEEIFTDLTPLAEKSGITLELAGDGVMTGSDALIYRMIFNLTENAIKYNRPDGSVQVCITQGRKASDPCFRYGTGNSGGISAEYLSALLPCRQVPQPNLRRCSVLVLRWYGRLQPFTEALSGLQKAQTAEPPSLQSCHAPAIMQQIPKTKCFRNNRMLALRGIFNHESKRTEMRGKHDR